MPLALQAIRPSRFKLIDPNKTRQELRAGLDEYLKKVRKRLLEGYAKATPVPRYRRTRRLARGFRIHVNRSGAHGELINLMPYSVFVIGPRGGGRGAGSRQSKVMREKGWPSITDVARETRREYAQIMNRRIAPKF